MAETTHVEHEPNLVTIESYEPITPEVFSSIAQYLSTLKAKALQEADFDLVDIALNGAAVMKIYKEPTCQKKSFLHVASRGGSIVGFSIAVIDDTGEVVSTFTGVDPQYRRQGIASQLVQARHDVLKARGVHEYNVSVHPGSQKVLEKVTGKPLRVPDNLVNEEQRKKVRIVDLHE